MLRFPVTIRVSRFFAPSGAGRMAALVLLLMAATSPLRADITMKFDDLKDGDKISDIALVILRADSGDGVDKVEFAVDDQLRFSTGSTPYTYKWDTIVDTEGAHSIAVTAIDGTGAKKTVKLTLTIDNQLALGAPALAQKAIDALQVKDIETATKFSRRALKAEPDNIDAARALAAIHADKLNWGRAISTLEKSKNLSGSSPAMLELASYHLQRSGLPENTANLVTDIESAVQLRRTASDAAIAAIKAKNLPDDQGRSHEILGDAYVNAGRYQDAIQEYSRFGGEGRLSLTNRLGLARVLNDQAQEATVLLRPLLRDKTGDAATRAVMGLALLRLRRFAEARDMVGGDLGGNSPASTIVAAYADAVQGKPNALQEAKDAAAARPNAGEAHYALSMTLTRLLDSETEVVKAMALSPFQSGPMIDYAVRYALGTDHPARFETGLKLLQIVLKAEPANRSAQLAKALLLFHTKRVPEAEPILAELNSKDAQSADVQVAAAIYFDLKSNPTAVNERMKLADKYDPNFRDHFVLGTVPSPLEFLYLDFRKFHYRGGFYLSPETLYPAKVVAGAAP